MSLKVQKSGVPRKIPDGQKPARLPYWVILMVGPRFAIAMGGMMVYKRRAQGAVWGLWFALSLAIGAGLAGPAWAQSPVARIGYLSSAEGELYRPQLEQTARHLSREVPGCRFELLPLNQEKIQEALEQGTLDFVFLEPALYVRMEAQHNLKRLAMAQSQHAGKDYSMLGGVLFCLKNRPDLENLRDLMNGVLATVQDEPLGAWLSVLRELRARHFDPERSCKSLLLLKNDEEAVLAVLNGEADAGAARAGTLERMSAAGRIKLADFRVMYFKGAHTRNATASFPFLLSTRLYSEWTLAATPKTHRELTQKTAAALLTMPRESSPGMLWAISDSYIPVHDCLKDLRRAPYENYGRISLVEVLRQYMYWLIGAGALFVLMVLTTSYVTGLNRELVSEIESRKKAEASLRESVERFQHVVSCSMDWIWEADAEGRFIYSSAIVKDMLGYESADVIGKRIFDLFTASEKEKHQDKPNLLASQMDRLFREKIKLATREGRVVIHEISAAPVTNAKGKVIGYRGVNRDITSQVRYVKL